jgi:hypothetical protein
MAQFRVPGVEAKAEDGDSPLPEGFPRATRPGTIEVKLYPGYRSAVAEGQGMTLSSGDSLFWSLFSHIDRNHIAMTAPVIQTFPREVVETPKARGGVSMEFLYRDPNMGKLGADGRAVEVKDHSAGSFVCLGIQGGMDERRMREGTAVLREWLEQHKSEWVESGSPRRLGYHGPMTPIRQRLWEVQLPIQAAESAESAPKADNPAVESKTD